MIDVEQTIVEKLLSETALMPWADLQRFFAQGNVLCVQKPLDLVQTAVRFAQDSAIELAPHIENKVISEPSNEQARAWYHNNVELWAVVVAPYVLVQEQSS